MALLVRKLVKFIFYILVFYVCARIDFYFNISENIVSWDFIHFLAKVFGVEGMGEVTMNIYDEVCIYFIASVSIVVYSFLITLAVNLYNKEFSVGPFTKWFLSCVMKTFALAIVCVIIFYIVIILLGFIFD
ncbi:MAG: hypothetical protein P4L95_13070 [Rouxiella aceris]|uniref:hypothetical protein n=1 Tax=Rouxiella aceris TaxID=2703884 RepID=UPI0028441570|nr:hypothetical protein [Rouxiella aceris]MDR3432813.1 hypothetical protein [Rouxiella aceris]